MRLYVIRSISAGEVCIELCEFSNGQVAAMAMWQVGPEFWQWHWFSDMDHAREHFADYTIEAAG